MWDMTIYKTKVLFDAGKITEALQSFAKARQVAPPGVTAEAWFSRELISSNSLASGGEKLDTVLYNSLRASIENEEEFGNCYVLLAAAMIRDGRAREAEGVLRRAVLEFPHWPLPKAMLATLESAK
jgi:tetratricopeptide (TPR) repeat protein